MKTSVHTGGAKDPPVTNPPVRLGTKTSRTTPVCNSASGVMKQLSKMGSATDLPAHQRQLSRPLHRSLFRARPRPSSSCSGIRGLALDPRPRLSIAPAFRPSSTRSPLLASTNFDPVRPISTFSTEFFFRVISTYFDPTPLSTLNPQPLQ